MDNGNDETVAHKTNLPEQQHLKKEDRKEVHWKLASPSASHHSCAKIKSSLNYNKDSQQKKETPPKMIHSTDKLIPRKHATVVR